MDCFKLLLVPCLQIDDRLVQTIVTYNKKSLTFKKIALPKNVKIISNQAYE